ncbi:MAG: NAD-dependent epimerase/dehydratase family protein [Anaerolineae bacterium]
MRILVLGGTTFFGADIVRHLLAAGHAVAIFTRGAQRPDFWERVEHIQGDRQDYAGFRDRFASETFDAVIDNIAYTSEDVACVLAALRGRVGRYVLTSTGSVYRYAPPAVPILEDSVNHEVVPSGYDPSDGGWQYAAGKVAAEWALMGGDVAWTILRPPIVLGPSDPTLRGYYYFQRLMDGGPLLLSNGGVASFRLAYSDDLARAYLLALDSPQAAGRAYNICQAEIVTLRQMLEQAAEALALPLTTAEVPSRVLAAAHLSGGPYSHMVNFVPSIRRAQTELGYTTTPFAAWLAQTVRWYRDEYRGGASADYDRRADELAFAERWWALLEATQEPKEDDRG